MISAISFANAISAVSLVISVVAIMVSYRRFREDTRRSIQPVLVFGHGGRDRTNKSIWYVHNVGYGPAINVVIAGGDMKRRWDQERAARFPAVARDQRFGLKWVGPTGALLATYSDVDGRSYTTICIDAANKITLGNPRPDVRPGRASWQLSKDDLSETGDDA